MPRPNGVAFLAILTATSITGSLILTPIATFGLLIGRALRMHKGGVLYRLVHGWANLLQGSWFHMCSILLESLLGVRVSCETLSTQMQTLQSALTKPTSPGKFNILISNHRTRIDWMLLWILLSRTGMLTSLKIVLKGSLASAPFFGWAMQSFRFIFLTRKWETDKMHLENVFAYFKSHQESATILIFPEGTDLSESNIAKSHAFAEVQSLPKYRYVLNPRTTGLVAIKNIIGVENIEHVYDITMGYTDHPSEGRPSEKSLLNGRPARCVHFLCRKCAFHAASEGDDTTIIPADDDGFKKWIEQAFNEKESLLSSFYTTSPPAFDRKAVTHVYGSKVTLGHEGTERSSWLGRLWRSISSSWRLSTAVVFVWCIPSVCLFKYLFFMPNVYVWAWAIGMSIAYVVVGKTKGGVDRWLQFPSTAA